MSAASGVQRPFPHSELRADRVVKRRPPAMIAVEAEKTRRAAEIGARTGLFRVPAVIAADPEGGTLETERIDDLVRLHEILVRGGETSALLESVGRALAAIHEQLELPEAMRVPLPEPWSAPEAGPMVAIHGDFNTLNLFVRGGTGELVITDWETSFQAHLLRDPAPHELPTIGPRYFDLAWFVASLFRRTWLGIGRIGNAGDRTEVFLRGYAAAAGPAARLEGFARYLEAFTRQREATDARLGVSRHYWLRHPRSLVAWYGAVRAWADSLAARRPERAWERKGSPGE